MRTHENSLELIEELTRTHRGHAPRPRTTNRIPKPQSDSLPNLRYMFCFVFLQGRNVWRLCIACMQYACHCQEILENYCLHVGMMSAAMFFIMKSTFQKRKFVQCIATGKNCEKMSKNATSPQTLVRLGGHAGEH